MDIRIFYCKHCGIKYQHQLSGEGCFDQKSSKDYCEECNQAILKALSKIPKKVIENYIELPTKIIESLKSDIENKLKEKNIRMCTIIGLNSYESVKINYPDDYHSVTLYYNSDKCLIKARFDAETKEFLEYV